MSDKNYTENQEEVLEQNLSKLLQQASEGPKIAPEARSRIKQSLLAKQQERAALLSKTEAKPEPQAKVVPIMKKRNLTRLALGGVAALLAAGLAALLLLPKGALTLTRFENVKYQNDAESVARFVLPDGSTLLLQKGASAESTDERALTLNQGSALFDIVPGAPFVVSTPQGDIQVLGTRFIVESGAQETEAAVIRGVVKLMGAQPLELHAGEFGAISKKAPPARRPAEKMTYAARWAKDALSPNEEKAPARSGLLLARNPQWQKSEWPLPLRKLTVDVYIEDQVARVALDQTFFNFTSFVLEGVYSFPLPSDAALSRLAMYIDGKKMEAGIAERNAARNVYESIVYQRRDPALLEWVQGNLFQLKIFPLPARSEKRILLSYTQPLAELYGSYRLEVPMPALEQNVGEVEYKVRVVRGKDQVVTSPSHPIVTSVEGDDLIVTVSEKNVRLGKDLLLDIKTTTEEPGVQLSRFETKDAKYLLASVAPQIPGETRYQPRRWAFLYDTSASRRDLLKAQVFTALRLLQELDEDDEISLIAFDTTVRRFSERIVKIKELNLTEIEEFFTKQQAQGIGDTNLEGALSAALSTLENPGDKAPFVLYLGDGLDTRDATVKQLSAQLEDKATFVAVALGDTFDASLLRGLAEKTGGLFMSLNPGDDVAWRCFDLVASLNTPRILGLEASLVDADGRELSDASAYPSTRQLAAGERLRIAAKLGATNAASMVLKGFLNNEPWTMQLDLPQGKAGAKYAPRQWAEKRISALSQDKEKNQAEITALGLEHFLLTPFTSLLVLENDEMYKTFKVNRGSEDDWARYAAPDKIPSVVEPTGSSFAIEIPSGAKLYRTPIAIFAGSQFNNQQSNSQFMVTLASTDKAKDSSREANEDTITAGLSSLGLRGTGTGGGGEGRADPSTGAVIGAKSAKAEAAQGSSAGPLASRTATFRVGGQSDLFDDVERKKSTSDAFGGRDDANLTNTAYKSIFAANKEQGVGRGSRRNMYGYYQNITLMPQAFNYSYDTRLDDLTEYLPGLFGDPLDLEQEALIIGAEGKKGSISPEALSLIEAARAKQSASRYQTQDGDTLEVNADGSFSWSRHFDTGLREEMSYDGTALLHTYAELSLAARREASPVEALLYARWAPFLTARPEALSLYQVTAKGSELTLSPLQAESLTLRISFGDNGRPAAIHIGEDIEITLAYSGDSITLTSGEDTTTFTALPAEGIDSALPADFVVVNLPLVEPAALMTTAAAGSEEWRALQWQKLASYSALSNLPERMNVLREIVKETKSLRRGELALASGGIQQITDKKELKQLTALLPKDDALGQYAAAIWRISYNTKGAAANLSALAAKNKDSLLGMLSSYRAILSTTQGYYNAPSSASIEKFLTEYPYAPFCYIMVYQYSSYYSWQHPKTTTALWDKLGDTIAPLRYFAKYEAARTVYNYDYEHRETAADLFEELADEEMAKGNEPLVDYTFFYALSYTAEGQTRWQRFFNKWRSNALKSGSAESMANWLWALSFTGRPENEVNRVVPALRQLKFKSAAEVMPLIEVFSSYGRYDVAQDLLAPWLNQKDTPAGLFDIAAQLAESNGDNVLGAQYLSRSLELMRDTPMPLSAVREKYKRLFTLYSREAQSMHVSTGAIEKALSLAAEWRSFDPDFAERELMCASLLYSADQPEEAWRYASTIIELHPADGASFETVATYLEGESQWERALTFWERAAAKEPTNPTWLHRQALLALTMGDKEKAKALLSQIEKGKWQDRFFWVTYQAKNLQKQLKK